MSLDPDYLESGRFDPQRNPIAYQLSERLIQTSGPDATDIEITELADDMMRAIAILEDQIAELRGTPAVPAENLIHISEDIDRRVVETGRES